MNQELDILKLFTTMSFYDVLCIVPLYLAVRSVIRQNYRNMWLLFLAQFTIIFYLFQCGYFVINSRLVSFSFLLLPIAIDSYKGSALWSTEGFFQRTDGIAHLVTACMLVYQHPYASDDQLHLWFIVGSVFIGFMLGFTAIAPVSRRN